MDLLTLRYILTPLVHREIIDDLNTYIHSGKVDDTHLGANPIYINRRIGYFNEHQTLYILYQGEGIRVDFDINTGYSFISPNGVVETADWDEVKQKVREFFTTS